MLRCATRRAQSKYLKGMLAGTVAIGAVIAAVTVALMATGDLTRLGGQLLLVATAGMVGAVVGLVFALGAIVLVMGELIPLDQQDGTSQSALFAGIGFLAGFSERLAQDMFVRSGQGLAGAQGESPSAGPSAGLSPTPGAIVGSGRASS